MLDDLLDRFRHGDRVALARLISLLARGEQVEAILSRIRPSLPSARVAALTGGGGVGKSTLAGKLVEKARENNKKVAVLACDPQSPLTGGALLGDRFRMPAHPEDDGVFIRSLAAAGGRGALADNLPPLLQLVSAFGFELVLIETVGAGQGDTAVRALVDILVLMLQPETGDDLQWEKAGLLEVADVVVIHKADLPGADRVEAQVLAAVSLSSGHTPPVLRVSSRTGLGLDELWQTISSLPTHQPSRRDNSALLQAFQQTLVNRFHEALATGVPDVRKLVSKWQQGELDTEDAAAALVEMLGDSSYR